MLMKKAAIALHLARNFSSRHLDELLAVPSHSEIPLLRTYQRGNLVVSQKMCRVRSFMTLRMTANAKRRGRTFSGLQSPADPIPRSPILGAKAGEATRWHTATFRAWIGPAHKRFAGPY